MEAQENLRPRSPPQASATRLHVGHPEQPLCTPRGLDKPKKRRWAVGLASQFGGLRQPQLRSTILCSEPFAGGAMA